MTGQDVLTIVQTLDGLPLHAILIFAIVILWRKVNDLEKALEDCLKGGGK